MQERNAKGQFTKGHPGTGGRPPRATEEAYKEAFTTSVTPDRWAKVIAKALEQAEAGDDKARKFLADYLIGPPVQEQKHSGQVQLIWKPHKPTGES